MYICLVCGYDKLEKPQYNSHGDPTFVSCDCCGFESGFDDDDQGYTFETYRENWLRNNATWFFPDTKPDVWDKNTLVKQLKRINVKINIDNIKM